MDDRKYSTLMDAVAAVPDPRKRRGKRHPWALILTLLSAALVCGQHSGRAIGQWVEEHSVELLTQLPIPQRPLPSTSTLRRALRTLDVVALEDRLAQFAHDLDAATPPAAATPWHGQAVDGKAVRGAQAHGAKVHLVSLAWHATGRLRKQGRVRDKSNEITAVPTLLHGRDLRGTVTTMDAFLTQQAIAQQILDQHGHYLMIVKENQPALYAAIDLLFQLPPPPTAADHVDHVTTVEKGHGRLETRTLERSCALNDYVDWPGVGQVARRTCQRIILKTGVVSEEVTYGITSLGWQEARAAQLEGLWRGHWSIENKVHYVRDVTLGEDAGQIHVGNAPQALAGLRNGLLSLLRSKGVISIADALRHYGASLQQAFELIGVPL
ncbi:MAG: ISAs1 family transposase [Chloroflexota bacterium]|nr:ISAs1 family transposase [Chloroflexota bacterium]